jgi:hypothetical protein
MKLAQRLISFSGLDPAVVTTISSKLFQSLASILIILLVANNLTPIEQGIYYTFASIIGLQSFVELGLSIIIIQFLSHESSKINISNEGIITGDIKTLQRIKSFYSFIFKWFGSAFIIILIGLYAIGYFFFKSSIGDSYNYSWQPAWLLLTIFFSLYFFVNPFVSSLEGLGKVYNVALLRLSNTILSALFMVVVFETGYGLFAPAASYFILFTISTAWLALSWRRQLFKSIYRVVLFDANKISWFEEIFSLQWRLALSWIGGSLAFLLFNPVLFYYHGAEIAGQMGMSLAVLTGISSLAMAWISTKAHPFGKLISLKGYLELDKLFYKNLFQSLVALIFLLVILFLILHFVGLYFPQYRQRILNNDLFIMLSLVTLANHLIFAMATYLRAHKKEPLLKNSVVIGSLIGASTVYFGKIYGVYEIILGYVCLSLVSLIWVTLIFYNKKKVWHE